MLSLEASAEAQSHPHWLLVERVLSSRCFQTSVRLREFLLYVSDCALRNAPDEATEQHIGIHVFQRAPGFNSGEDSIVRTHARSLRQKLGDYFSDEGANEETVITIPKGHYLPIFELRHPSQETAQAIDADTAAEATPNETGPGHQDHPQKGFFQPVLIPTLPFEIQSLRQVLHSRLLWAAVAALLVVIGIGIGLHYREISSPQMRFWAPFLEDDSTLVIYSNALFTGDSTNGLRYAAPPAAHQPLPDNYVDDYTGIGELTGVYDLTRLFDQHHAHFVLKRSLLVAWDEARQSNMVFIGSTAENPSLRALSATQDFSITARPGFSGVANHHPASGEPEIYERPEHPLTKDYAILALLPGLQPGKKMLVCSGLTTMGTQAAVEFAVRPETLAPLLAKITDKQGNIHPFEAVLETSIVGGVSIEPRLVTVHVH